MRKLTKRAVALVLMVAMLAAFMVPVTFADGTEAKKYEYDFRLDQTDMLWNNATYKFGGTSLPHGNASAISVLDAAYDTLGWNYPHKVGEDGKVSNADMYANKSYGPSALLFGGTHYNINASVNANLANTETKRYYHDGLRYNASSAANNHQSDAWFNLLIKAPDAGTYTLTYDYNFTGSDLSVLSGSVGVHIVPYTTELKAEVASNAETFNASVDEIVAAGNDLVGGEEFALNTAASASVEVGEITFGTGYDEYLVIISTVAAKTVILDKLTFTEVAETAETIPTIDYNFLNTNTVDNWEALASDKTIEASGSQYKRVTYNPTYLAVKIASPGAGTYDLSLVTYYAKGVANSTHIPMNVYILEYTEGMEFSTSVPAGATQLSNGYHPTPKSENGNHDPVNMGSYAFEANKDYVIYFQKDSANVVAASMALNIYLVSMSAEPQVTSVPKAQIGDTTYSTITGAAAVATSGQTVKMLTDYTGDIDLPTGVSLDLNGNTWTVSEYTAASANEKIIDSTGDGVLKCDKLNLYGNNGGFMPLYDAAKGGYTMNAYTVEMDATPVAVDNAQRFWFNVKFADADALALVANGGTKMTLGADVLCGNANLDAPLVGDQDSAENFAKAYATAKKANDNIWLYIDVTGLAAQSGKTLTLTPTLELNGQAFELTNGNFTYNCQ